MDDILKSKVKVEKGTRTLVVTPYISDDCKFDVYINGEKHEPLQKGELYRFTIKCNEFGYHMIKLVVHSGEIIINDNDSIAFYPLWVEYDTKPEKNKWTRIPIYQRPYMKWMDADYDFSKKVSAGKTIEYRHLFPNGPNHVEYRVEYTMPVEVKNDYDFNTDNVLDEYENLQ